MAAGSKIEQVKTTVRRAVDEAQHLRGRIEEAVEDLRTRLSEAALANLAEDELEALLEEMREEAREEAREEMRREAREAEAAPAAPVAGPSSADLLAAAAALDRARGQKQVLDTLLAESERFAPRALLLLVRPDRLAGWGARGLAIDRDRVRSLSLDRGDDLWAAIVQGEGDGGGGAAGRRLDSDDSAALVDRLAPGGVDDAGRPVEGALVPMVLRDRVSALLYVDRMDGDSAVDLESLQLLTHFAALSLETLALRQRESTATLAPIPPLAEPAADTEEAATESEELDDPVGSALGQPAAEVEAPETPDSDDDEIALEPAPEAEESTTPPHGDELPTGAPVTPATPVEDDDEEEQEDDEPAAEASTPSWAAPATDWQAPTTPTTPADDTLPEVEAVEEEPADEPTPEPTARETVGGYSDFEVDEDLDAPELGAAPELEEPPVAGETIAWSTDEDAGDAEEAEQPVLDEVEEVDVEDLDLGDDAGPVAEIQEAQEVEVAPEPDPASGAETTLLPTMMPEVADDDKGQAAVPEASPRETTSTPIAAPAPTATSEGEPDAPATAAGPAGSGGQVTPPADVEGPGWAFNNTGAAVPSGDQAAHDEARRLARLLVSEIQLYNQEEVEEGRRNNDVYERLREDIDRSRQLYEERVDPSVRESTDYFYQELVRQLAAGDAKALGI